MRNLLLSLLALAGLLGPAKATAQALPPTAQPTPLAPSPAAPVFRTNFPDPFILPHGNEFLAYATNPEGAAVNVPMARSPDLVTWRLVRRGQGLHDAMPALPRWAREGWTWAPEVLPHAGGYLLYFTAKERSSGLQCVGVARAKSPHGPFRSRAAAPLVCQRALGGTIDPHAFRDADGRLYLYFKNDGNHPRFALPTDIFVQRLTDDGLRLAGEAVPLLRNDKPWEAHVIESPTMTRADGRYVLFFSANHFGWEDDQVISPYAMGYATCAGPMGPCADAPENPILSSRNDAGGCLSGPGHQALFESRGRQYIVFHAHAALPGCRDANLGRHMYIAPLLWEGGRPRIGPTLRRRGAPAVR